MGQAEGAFGDSTRDNIAARLVLNAAGVAGTSAVSQIVFDNSRARFDQVSLGSDGSGAAAPLMIAVLSLTTGTPIAFSAADIVFVSRRV